MLSGVGVVAAQQGESVAEGSASGDTTLDRLCGAKTPESDLRMRQAMARLQQCLFGAAHRPELIDRYELVGACGEGTSGTVYEAHDPRLARRVAVKLLRQTTPCERATARLVREARSLARSPHPNVVPVFDIGTHRDGDTGHESLYIAMEFVDGPSLADWLTEPRRWKDVLRVFVQAGRGLAAAHAAGIVHRDFKPANAMLGADGRVRVLDFGLALDGIQDEDLVTVPGDDQTDQVPTLTVQGSVLGTPLFMPPEQHRGEPASPASDQYAFCAALWWGLFGTHPFQGTSTAELLKDKLSRSPAYPADSDVPRWLREALARGLSPRPHDRWPSMRALLRTLGRRSFRRGTGLAVLAGLACIGAFVPFGAAAPPPPCSAPSASTPWTAQQRSAVSDRFDDSTLAFAPDSKARVTAALDRFADTWSTRHRDACEAAHMRSETSAPARLRCLERQAGHAESLIAVLESADADVVQRAVDLVQTLPDPARCDDPVEWARIVAPTDPSIAEAVAEIRDELQRSRALRVAGKRSEALEVSRLAHERAEGLGYGPLQSEAELNLGNALVAKGNAPGARDFFARAYRRALSSGNDELAAKAAVRLVAMEGTSFRNVAVAERWAALARVQIDRSGAEDLSPDLELAETFQRARMLDRAESHVAAELQRLEAQPGAAASDLHGVHLVYGNILRYRGELEGSREHLEHSLALGEEAYGPNHPLLTAVHHGLAELGRLTGEYETAETHLRTALRLREQLDIEHDKGITAILNSLGMVLAAKEDVDEARTALRRAADMSKTTSDPLMPGFVLVNLANLEQDQGRYEQALRVADESIETFELRGAAKHPDLAAAYNARAFALQELGRHDDAEEALRHAVELQLPNARTSPQVVAQYEARMVKLLVDNGKREQARQWAERARSRLPADAHPHHRREIERFLVDV